MNTYPTPQDQCAFHAIARRGVSIVHYGLVTVVAEQDNKLTHRLSNSKTPLGRPGRENLSRICL